MIPKSYFIIAANILKKPCTMIVTTKLNTDNYKNIVNIWKRYRFFNKLPIYIKEDYILNEVFKFHLNTNINHAILYYSCNMDNALLLYKIYDKFFSVSIPAYSLTNHNKNIIAIITQ